MLGKTVLLRCIFTVYIIECCGIWNQLVRCMRNIGKYCICKGKDGSSGVEVNNDFDLFESKQDAYLYIRRKNNRFVAS
jgi:hypothetical protein